MNFRGNSGISSCMLLILIVKFYANLIFAALPMFSAVDGG